ncbi:MAG TPA: DUF4124 domain-containing protein [Steroidobacteraceae bacterium]|jgi:hypothetical protein
MKRLSLLMTSLAVASIACATTYVRVEKDGTKTYSDRPLPGGQPVELESAQTYSAPTPAETPNPNVPAEQRLLSQIDDFRYESCSISPENDATFTNPLNVPVSATIVPPLRVGDVAQLTIDGKPAARNATTTVLDPAYRGTHTAQITVKDQFGRTLCTASASFHVFRPSRNLPGRR